MKKKAVCKKCQSEIPADCSCCTNCGAKYSEEESLEWEVKLKVFTNMFFWKNILKGFSVLVILFNGSLLALYLYMEHARRIDPLSVSDPKGMGYGFIMINSIFILAILVMMIFSREYRRLTYLLDDEYIRVFTRDFIGFSRISRAFQSMVELSCGDSEADDRNKVPENQNGSIEWKEIKIVEFFMQQKAIRVRGVRGRKLMVYCTRESYSDAASFIAAKTGTKLS